MQSEACNFHELHTIFFVSAHVPPQWRLLSEIQASLCSEYFHLRYSQPFDPVLTAMFAVSYLERGAGAVGCRSVCWALDSIIRPLLQPKGSYNPGTCKFVPFLRSCHSWHFPAKLQRGRRDKSQSAARDVKSLFSSRSLRTPEHRLLSLQLDGCLELPFSLCRAIMGLCPPHRVICSFQWLPSESEHLVLSGVAEAVGYVPSHVAAGEHGLF